MQDDVQAANTFGKYPQTLSSPREEFAVIYPF
jgi:hypothetical protein